MDPVWLTFFGIGLLLILLSLSAVDIPVPERFFHKYREIKNLAEHLAELAGHSWEDRFVGLFDSEGKPKNSLASELLFLYRERVEFEHQLPESLIWAIRNGREAEWIRSEFSKQNFDRILLDRYRTNTQRMRTLAIEVFENSKQPWEKNQFGVPNFQTEFKPSQLPTVWMKNILPNAWTALKRILKWIYYYFEPLLLVFAQEPERPDRRAPQPVRSTGAYAVLGLPNTASRQEILKAYRTLMKRFHPDHTNEVPPEKAAEIVMALHRAKSELIDGKAA